MEKDNENRKKFRSGRHFESLPLAIFSNAALSCMNIAGICEKC
jgi:hypothetical protein